MGESKGTSQPLGEFFEFATDFSSVAAWIGKFAVIAPFADLALNIGPPWPSRAGICIILAIIEFIVLMWSFEFWRDARSKRAGVRRTMKVAVICLGILFVTYIILFGMFVFELPDSWHRDVGGFSYLPIIKEMRDSDPTKYTDSELLELFSRSPERVWTRSSIVIAKVALCVTWFLLWISLIAVIASFIALRWRRRDSARTAKKRRRVQA